MAAPTAGFNPKISPLKKRTSSTLAVSNLVLPTYLRVFIFATGQKCIKFPPTRHKRSKHATIATKMARNRRGKICPITDDSSIFDAHPTVDTIAMFNLS